MRNNLIKKSGLNKYLFNPWINIYLILDNEIVMTSWLLCNDGQATIRSNIKDKTHWMEHLKEAEDNVWCRLFVEVASSIKDIFKDIYGAIYSIYQFNCI